MTVAEGRLSVVKAGLALGLYAVALDTAVVSGAASVVGVAFDRSAVAVEGCVTVVVVIAET